MVNGRMTSPYLFGLYTPRSWSAIDHTNDPRVLTTCSPFVELSRASDARLQRAEDVTLPGLSELTLRRGDRDLPAAVGCALDCVVQRWIVVQKELDFGGRLAGRAEPQVSRGQVLCCEGHGVHHRRDPLKVGESRRRRAQDGCMQAEEVIERLRALREEAPTQPYDPHRPAH